MSSIEDDPIYREATEWFLRLQAPEVSLQQTLDWQAWLRRDPRHAQAFKVVEGVWQKFEHVPVPRAVPPDDVQRDTYDGQGPVSAWRLSQASPDSIPVHGSRWHRTAFVSSAALSVAILGIVGYRLLGEPAQTRSIETARGEIRATTLPDGSQIQLGGGSRVDVRFDRHRRQLQLVAGEAYFTAARERERPFEVAVGGARVTAIGTEFNVVRNSDRVVVSVTDGRVAVQPESGAGENAASATAELIDAGERFVIDASGVGHAESAGGIAGEWRKGRLAFEGEPLRYVIEDINRYAAKPLVLADETLGEIRVTGTVDQANIRGWVSSLESVFGISAREEPGRLVLRRN